ncbi:MAG: hypothetical protein QGI63_04710 [Rhodospirillales bacterium]|jgi:plastocyanin|nr:hypothetical protein [Rhodospirillales bacterium]MDP6773551.1 hypothetical protein [Rhodospirillales bacterium]|tara:strand:+ start:191 stop:586 length:396 start_codon:yes stop_codon:yes gene_type:complete
MAARIMMDNLRAIGSGVLLLVMTGVGGFSLSAADPVVRTFEVNIDHGHVAEGMRTMKVKQGDMVRIRITSDEAVSLHLHGYDIEKAVKPGSVAEFSFEAYAAGRFPINVHGGHHAGGHGESALLRLEVYPR